MWRVLFPLHIKLATWSMTWISRAGSGKLWPLGPSHLLCAYVFLCKWGPGASQVKEGVGSEGEGAGLPGSCLHLQLTPVNLPALFHTPLAPGLFVPLLTSGTAKSRPETADKNGKERNLGEQGSLPLTSPLPLGKSLILFRVFLIFNRNSTTYLTCLGWILNENHMEST